MKIRTIFFTVLGIFSSSSTKAIPRALPVSQFLQRIPNPSLSDAPTAIFYDVDSAALAKALSIGGAVQITNFPGSYNDLVTLDLKPAHSPIDSTTQFWEGTSGGAVRISPPSFAVYRGKVLGEPDSHVVLTTFGGTLLASIMREDGTAYEFGPAKNDADDPAAHIFIREADLFSFGEFYPLNCIAGDLSQPNAPTPVPELIRGYRERGMSPLGDTAHSRLLQTDIAVEADSSFYHAAGGTMALALGYIESLFAMSSTIYEDEANITWHLTWVKVWPNGDPYNVKGNAYGLIDTVPKYWKAHYDTVPRDLAHVLTSVGYGGGGYGYYSLCDPNWSYSMSSPQTGHSYPTFAFTYDAYIVAHEIGHNFSLVHSEECYWDPPLDTCFTKDDTIWGLKLGDACDSLPVHPLPNPGSIMSYCANANYAIHHDSIQYFQLRMTFTKKVDSVLRMNAENTACITSPATPTLLLLSPRGSETYPGDTTISIQWTFANIDSVSLEYSPDGGTFWNTIASSLPADLGIYSWKIPNISSKSMLVRVVSNLKGGSIIADTSLLFFTIVPSIVSTPKPKPMLEFLQNPAHDDLALHGGTAGERLVYSIVNASGAIVASGETLVDGASESHFPLDFLPSGTYYLRITSPFTLNLSFTHLE